MVLHLPLACRLAPVVPAIGDDNVAHVGVHEDDTRVGAPSTPQVDIARAHYTAA